jgi:hypothetical protein
MPFFFNRFLSLLASGHTRHLCYIAKPYGKKGSVRAPEPIEETTGIPALRQNSSRSALGPRLSIASMTTLGPGLSKREKFSGPAKTMWLTTLQSGFISSIRSLASSALGLPSVDSRPGAGG